jgi:hypothetical protein
VKRRVLSAAAWVLAMTTYGLAILVALLCLAALVVAFLRGVVLGLVTLVGLACAGAGLWWVAAKEAKERRGQTNQTAAYLLWKANREQAIDGWSWIWIWSHSFVGGLMPEEQWRRMQQRAQQRREHLAARARQEAVK